MLMVWLAEETSLWGVLGWLKTVMASGVLDKGDVKQVKRFAEDMEYVPI